MAPKSTASIPIGNFEVSVEAAKFACESDGKSLQISVSGNAKIQVSVRKNSDGKSREVFQSTDLDTEGEKEIDASYNGKLSFVVVNAKDRLLCGESRLLVLQTVLEMYNKEIHSMPYCYKTFGSLLKNYCSLLLNMTKGGSEKVIAAISYQIMPTGTQYAEVYLTAVNPAYQRKGVGRTLFEELRKRLQSVGVTSIISRVDEQSEGFWHKQGFVSLSEESLDDNLRKALSYPSLARPMILHLKQGSSAHTADSLKLSLLLQPKVTVVEVSNSEDQNAVETVKRSVLRTESPHCDGLRNDVLPCAEKEIDGSQCQDSRLIATSKSKKLSSEDCASSTQGSVSKRIWEASLSSSKSKKLKSGRVLGLPFGRKNTSKVWNFFNCERRVVNGVQEKWAICKKCKERIYASPRLGTGYLTRHAKECYLNGFSEALYGAPSRAL